MRARNRGVGKETCRIEAAIASRRPCSLHPHTLHGPKDYILSSSCSQSSREVLSIVERPKALGLSSWGEGAGAAEKVDMIDRADVGD